MNEKAIQTKQESSDLEAAGREIQTLLPGGNKLQPNQAMALAKVAQLTDANPFRGEIYGYQGRGGQLAIVEGYKLLIRWAERISPYNDTYDLIAAGENGVKPGDIGYRCWIFRTDQREQLKFYIELGASFQEAWQMVAKAAVGVVTKSEMGSPAPQGWTWDEVARKRALKNALNRAYGMPSIRELAEETWKVGQTETKAEDWETAEIYKTKAEQEHAAQVNAWHREAQTNPSLTPDQVKAATAAMRNNGDDDPLDLSPEEGEFTDLPAGDPDFPAGNPGQWMPTLQEFKDQIGFDFGLTWDEAKDILKQGGFAQFKGSDPEAMYNYLKDHHQAFVIGGDKPMVPHQDGLFTDDESAPDDNGAYSE